MMDKTEGTVRMMEGMDMSKPDSVDLAHIAECFSRMGCEVVILRPVHFKSPDYSAIYGPIIGTKYERKRPDRGSLDLRWRRCHRHLSIKNTGTLPDSCKEVHRSAL